MPRGRTKARNERALNEGRTTQKELDRRDYTAKARKIARRLRAAPPGPKREEAAEALVGLIEGLDGSDLLVWSFEAVLREGALNAEDWEDIKAIISQVVARHLAGGSSNSAKRRYARAM